MPFGTSAGLPYGITSFLIGLWFDKSASRSNGKRRCIPTGFLGAILIKLLSQWVSGACLGRYQRCWLECCLARLEDQASGCCRLGRLHADFEI